MTSSDTNSAAITFVIPKTGQLTEFNAFRSQLAELKKENASLVFDYDDPLGNKRARSYVYTLRRSKTAVEILRKDAKKAALDYGKAVDANAKTIIGDIEGMIEQHWKPIKAAEEREDARISAIEVRIESMRSLEKLAGAEDIDSLENRLSILDTVYDFDFQEQDDLAVAVEEQVRYRLNAAMSREIARVEREKEEILEMERREEEQRLEKEALEAQLRDEREAREALEQKVREAEEREETRKQELLAEDRRLAAEALRLKEEAEKLEQARIESARQLKEDAEALERKKAEAEQQEKRRIEAEAARLKAEEDERKAYEAAQKEAEDLRESRSAELYDHLKITLKIPAGKATALMNDLREGKVPWVRLEI